MLQKKKLFRFSGIFILFLSLFLLTTSCGKEITDFFKAIDRYGFKTAEPLDKKTIPVDNLLLGGYVYNDLPVIISQKDKFTYQLTFLAVELDKENSVVEAYMSEINNSRYLNINMGETYAFLKMGSVINNNLEIKLLRNTIEPYVEKGTLKDWLTKHGSDESYTPENQSPVDIFYSFTFNKITVDKAYQIQTEQLHEKMVDLFESCKDYYTYTNLEKRYPNEPLLSKAREGIYYHCTTIEAYQAFIDRFPNDALVAKAKARIDEIKMYKADSLNFSNAAKQNTIEAYENFISNSATAAYKDTATRKLAVLGNAITENDIEWRWTGSSKTDAMKLIFQKIDYANPLDNAEWVQQHLTFYCLKMQQPDVTEKGLLYLDKLAAKKPSTNDMLNLYLSKGFLLWSLERTDQAMDVFRSKIEESYTGDNAVTFRAKIKAWYKSFKDSDIVFPKEKSIWKKIRKL